MCLCTPVIKVYTFLINYTISKKCIYLWDSCNTNMILFHFLVKANVTFTTLVTKTYFSFWNMYNPNLQMYKEIQITMLLLQTMSLNEYYTIPQSLGQYRWQILKWDWWQSWYWSHQGSHGWSEEVCPHQSKTEALWRGPGPESGAYLFRWARPQSGYSHHVDSPLSRSIWDPSSINYLQLQNKYVNYTLDNCLLQFKVKF